MLYRGYLVYGLLVLSSFSVAAWNGWKIPKSTPSSSTSSSRPMGGGHGYWGGSGSSSGWSWGK